jgi:hypothetical protein
MRARASIALRKIKSTLEAAISPATQFPSMPNRDFILRNALCQQATWQVVSPPGSSTPSWGRVPGARQTGCHTVGRHYPRNGEKRLWIDRSMFDFNSAAPRRSAFFNHHCRFYHSWLWSKSKTVDFRKQGLRPPPTTEGCRSMTVLRISHRKLQHRDGPKRRLSSNLTAAPTILGEIQPEQGRAGCRTISIRRFP